MKTYKMYGTTVAFFKVFAKKKHIELKEFALIWDDTGDIDVADKLEKYAEYLLKIAKEIKYS